MKRLFTIKNKNTGKLFAADDVIMGPLFYSSKPEAKRFRNHLNAMEDKVVYVVSPGPDHRNYNNV